MADIKISELLPASTPLDGTETLPIVQNGNTVRASTQDVAGLFSLGYTAENVANKSTDSSFAGASDLNYPSQLAVKTYVDNTLGNAGWGLNGNSGTTSANFIGTIDNQDVVLKANNSTALTLRSSGANVDAAIRLRVYSETASIAYAQLDQSAGNGRMILRSSSGAASISSSGLTDTRAYTFPDKNGTLAIEEYKVYSAIVKFNTGQMQVVQQLQNTTGRTFTFATFGAISEITASSSLFTTNKTVFIGNSFVGSAVYNVIGGYFSATKLNVVAYDTNTQAPAVDNGYPFFIEIRIYS